MNRGLYIHFPFCEKKCNYCDFYSVADHRAKSDYINALIREALKFKDKKIKIDTVFFGGGTPSLFSPSELERVMTALNDAFIIEENAEITLEANPMTIKDGEKLSAFCSLGINRLSVGVQSFSDAELQALGRGHTRDDAVNTIITANKAGFDNISLDLMLGIPYQTEDTLKKSLDTALSLPITHISVYALSIEENTVFGKKQKKGEDLHLPENDRDMYLKACNMLEENGFEHYEISNFAKKGHRSRHNMKYWRAEEYIGLGASAHSYFEGERYAFGDSIKAFIESPERVDIYKNTPADRKEEFIFLSLRLSDGLDLERLEKEYGVIPIEQFFETVRELERHRLLKMQEGKIALTNEGFFVSNAVIVKILKELKI